MKKLMAILFAAIMLCSFFAISASAANVVDYEYIVELEQYSDGYVYLSYEFPERFATTNNPYGTDLLWVDIYVFEEGTEPAEGNALFDLMLNGELNDSNKLKKTENDDQFLATERWIGPVFDDAESVFLFETGKTYNLYFGCCNGAEWYYYSQPYTFTFTETAYGAGSTETEPPVTEAPEAGETTDVPQAGETTDVPQAGETTDNATTAPTDGGEAAPANNGWILWVAIAAVVVVVIVVVVIAASKKKKAE